MPLTYSALREIQKKEMESSEIVRVEQDFYEQVSALLKERKQAAMSDESMSALREYENIRKIAAGIQAKREEKIVLMALRGDKIHDGLTEKEHELLENILERLEGTRTGITTEWSRNNGNAEKSVEHKRETRKWDLETKNAERKTQDSERETLNAQPGTRNAISDTSKVTLLKDVAQYKGIDNKIYGPFKSKEQAILPTSEAEWLIRAKMAENIE